MTTFNSFNEKNKYITREDITRITGYNPNTNYKVGIKKFINWYLNYYN